MSLDKLLYFQRINVFTTSDDKVLHPADYLTIAIGRQNELVSCSKPPIRSDSILGLLFILPVSQHIAVAADQELSCGAERDHSPILVHNFGLCVVHNVSNCIVTFLLTRLV
uniref:Uncharacterized protein n=1 Tax=Cacopsylla melanoneura TaxID=428564 RepID=A0A8D8ZVE0_9HEMI